ncbi:histidine phosphatase family protein [Gordonia crocea]|uniref:Phosphoglycerate mutase n=1 Tax=Gordonia crocea TaxID=589162 RepID=A0A7I9UVY7_9ACTN|nr:histidine phosphatase family protein [Gordonia crocea]GED97338.1 hypothetical protein nbrc107697_13770 [Gordonia crocea]
MTWSPPPAEPRDESDREDAPVAAGPLIVVVAGRTGPNHRVRFGETDTALDERGSADITALAAPPGPVISGPERATRETASLLSSAVIVDAGLASLDVGRWTGLLPEEIPGAQMAAWFADPTARPHGGESLTAFVGRIQAWAVSSSASCLVVAGPVAQALICEDAASFFAVDVVPGAQYRLSQTSAS